MTEKTNDKAKKTWFRSAGRIVRDTGKFRVLGTVLFLLLALFMARYSWQVPFADNAERALYDVRARAYAPKVDQDPRVVMVVYNDQTLISTRKRSPLDRHTLANALKALDSMGAKAIGIDILIDQPQDEDAELIAALRGMKTPTFLGYTDMEANADSIIYEQQKFLDAFVKQMDGSKTEPASIRVDVDPDGVARSWPPRIKGKEATLALAMLGGAAEADETLWDKIKHFTTYDGSIRYRLPADTERPVFSSLPIDLFADPAVAAALQSEIQGRFVLIGGDIVDIDQFETPMTASSGKTMIGLEVHANMLAQALDNANAPMLPDSMLWLAAAIVVVAAGLTALLELKWWQLTVFIVIQVAAIIGLPFWLQSAGTDTQLLPAIGWIVGWGIAYAAVGSAARAVGSEQRKFAQSALGKYLPRDIASEIIADPDRLELGGEKRPIFVIFSDLEGFTKLSHAIAPEMVATLLNRYLEMLSEVVLEHGGTIDKFVGDAVVAFWGAPISRPDDGFNAARCAWAMFEAGEAFRKGAPEGVPPIGKTRVGLHYGEAIVGNFGGEGRIQYTALGDSMNTAARLESANKGLGTSVIASKEAVERSELDWWRPMGKIALRGRSTPVDIFEPAPEFSESDQDHLKNILDSLAQDRDGGLKELEALAARFPNDTALQNLLHRCQNSEDGEAYVIS